MAIQNKKQSLSSMLIRGAGDVTNKATQIVSAANRPGYNPSAQLLAPGMIQIDLLFHPTMVQRCLLLCSTRGSVNVDAAPIY